MERRQYNRISVGYKVTLISGDVTLEGAINDLSENGAKALFYTSEHLTGFIPETPITLKFQPSPTETLKLNCIVKWIDNLKSYVSKYKIGVEIINPPWEESSSFL